MTLREETLLFFDDFLKSIDLEYMIFASSLLGIVRDKKLMDHDAEIDICVLGKDLTDDMLSKIESSGFHTGVYECKEKVGETYLSKQVRHEGKHGWVAISPMWVNNKVAYINMLKSECITMNKKWHDKKNWGKLKYLGREFNCPKNPEEWLKDWYGDDWETPKEGHWKHNANLTTWEKITNNK